MMMRKLILFLTLILFSYSASDAQSDNSKVSKTDFWNAGIPFITTYMPEDYKGDSQNWSFVQADNGIMYVGNSAGILEFDGSSWNLIKLVNSGVVWSLAKSKNGTIYVGGSRDFGYLASDSTGNTKFYSLLSKLDKKYRRFSNVWHTYTIDDIVYFITGKYIFRWVDNSFRVFFPNEVFGFGFLVDDKIYVDDRGSGIKVIDGDSLRLIPGGAKFNNGGITSMTSYDRGRILIIHQFDGAFLYNKVGIKPLKKIKMKARTYGSLVLPNQDILIYSIGNGAYILDKEGNHKLWLNKNRGLSSDVVYGAYVDAEGGLWLANDNGINRIEISSPLRIYNGSNGLTEGVQNTLTTDQGLYVSTNNGLFSFSKSKLGFKKIDGIGNMTRNLLQIGDYILVGNLDGLYRVDSRNKVQIIKFRGDSYNILLHPTIDDSKIYVAGNSGNIYELKLGRKDWLLGKSILKIEGAIRQIVEDHRATTWWIATRYNGIYKVDWLLDNSKKILTKKYKIKHFGIDEGLPILSNNHLCITEDKIYISTESGIYNFDKTSQKFVLDSLTMKYIKLKNFKVGPMATDKDGIWLPIIANFENKMFKKEGEEVNEVVISRRFSNFIAFNVYNSPLGFTFFSGPQGIVAYDKRINHNNAVLFPVKIRRVCLNNDSTIFLKNSSRLIDNRITQLPYVQNSLRLIYTLPSYNQPKDNQFQYYLQGFDQSWSKWSLETKKDYTNLSEGNYTFRVRGKNIYGQVSKEDTYRFTILPPWHRTWWAYLLYILIATVLLWIAMQRRSRYFRSKNLVLENRIRQRTKEVQQKNKILNYQAERLKEKDTMKTRLFANISHEFRTPLTLIKGPIEQLETSQKNKISTINIKMIRRNANRLLKLVNQLLDLSKIDSGGLQLAPAEGDVYKCIRVAASSFSSHAAQRRMDYQIIVPSSLLWASFDRDKLEKIVYNLLSNAFKFTADEGKIIILAKYRNHELQVKVSDSGYGIEKSKLLHIFDRFFQVDDSYTKEKEGSGIGLSLTKELVEIMVGEIYVESEYGKGSIFKVVIPIEEIRSHKSESDEGVNISVFDYDSGDKSLLETTKKESKVLIVEDNNDMRHFIREQLIEDYKVIEASNGKEGLQKAIEIMPDLIITDLMMPQMDGIALCKKLKTTLLTSHIPVIMLTAKAGIENRIEGLETGADDYLTKPFNAKEVRVRVKNLIEERKKLRKLFGKNDTMNPKEITVSSLDQQFLDKTIQLLEDRYADPEFTIPEMQEILAISKTQLYCKLKALTDQSPSELLRNFRLKRAAQILAQQGDTVSQVAYTVGFNNLSYFAKCFKALYGKSPSNYQSDHKK